MGTQPIQALPTSYYSNLLTSQYRNTTQFNSWLSTVLNITNDITNCLQTITANFDLDEAVGNQLDVLGLIVGVSRTVNFQPSDSVSPVLDDSTYRILIKATIANNQWNGLISSLYPLWNSLFPGGSIVIIDNQNMTADIILAGTFTSIIQDLITNGLIIPRPETVQYNFIFGSLPFFGFDFDGVYIAGWDIGKWA